MLQFHFIDNVTEVVLSDQTDSTGSVAVVLQEENPSFLVGGLDLKKLLRDLSKHSKTAIDKIVVLMESKDEKVALAAAKTLLEMQTQVAKDMNTDQLQRLIAQVKLNLGGGKRLIPLKGEEEDEENRKPVVDFTTIQAVK